MGWSYHNKPPMGWPLDWDNHINDGLVGYWYMPEGSGGQVFDLSGNGNTGVITSIPWASGKYGSALDFPGDAGDLAIPHSEVYNFDGGKPVSIVMSLKINAWLGVGTISERLITKSLSSSDDENGWELGIYNDNKNILFRSIGGILEGNTALALNTQYQIVFTFDGTKGHFYINSVRESSYDVDTITSIKDTDLTSIHPGGFDSGSNRRLNGLYDFLYIYNRALTASELALLYRFPFFGFMNPDEIPVLDQYYTVTAGGIMTPNTKYWGAL